MDDLTLTELEELFVILTLRCDTLRERCAMFPSMQTFREDLVKANTIREKIESQIKTKQREHDNNGKPPRS